MLLRRFGGVEAKEFGEFAAILSIFVNTKLDVLAESFVELGVVVLILGDLADEIHGLLDNVLANDLEDLVLLKSLARNVERKIL